MWFDLEKKKSVKLKSPTLVVAVSTSMAQYKALYSQARELGEYLLDNMKFTEVAVVRSSAFPPEVAVRDDGSTELPSCRFYALTGGKDLLLFCGDTSPMESQFEFADSMLEFAEKLGVKEVVSVGARWAENPLPADAEPDVKGFATDKTGVERLKANGVKILEDEPAPFFASLVVALAAERGMRGYKLSVDHGEPAPHPRSVRKLLGALSSLVGVEIPLKRPTAEEGPPKPRSSDPGIYK